MKVPEKAEPKQVLSHLNRLKNREELEFEEASFFNLEDWGDHEVAAPLKGSASVSLPSTMKKICRTKAAVRKYLSPGCWAKLSDPEKKKWQTFCSVRYQMGCSSAKEIEKRSALALSVQKFIEDFESTRTPVLLTGLTTSTKAFPKKHRLIYNKLGEPSGSFSPDFLALRFGSREFDFEESGEGEEVLLDLRTYLEYVDRDADSDRNPLYLFDSNFHLSCPELLQEFAVPPYFQEDLLSLVGEEERFQWRWFVVGAARAGTAIHIDPLGTSAWNMLFHGRKRWVLFPPETPEEFFKDAPEDADDGDSDVEDNPQYVNEIYGRHRDDVYGWFTQKLDKIKDKIDQSKKIDHEMKIWHGIGHDSCQSYWYDFVQKAGETVFIPHGWWHAVINLDATIAVTQNFCSSTNLAYVWNSVKDKYPEKAMAWSVRMLEYDAGLASIMK